MTKAKVIEKLLELLQTSVLIQSTITLCLVIAVIVLWLTNRVVPDQLYTLLYVVLGYYFGSKTTYTMMKGRKQ